MSYRLLFLFITLFLTERPAAQQKEFLYKNLTQEEGLPSNEVYYIYRDSKEYLWIATNKGVTRYNGVRMEQFDLPDNVIFKIYEDHKGRVWFFSRSGKLAYFLEGKIYPYLYNEQISHSFKDLLIIDAYVDTTNNIHLNSHFGWNYQISPEGKVIALNYSAKGKQSDTLRLSISSLAGNKLFLQKQEHYEKNYDVLLISVQQKDKKKHKYIIPIHISGYTVHYEAIQAPDKILYLFIGNFLVRLNPDGTYLIKQLESRILSIKALNNNLLVGFEKGGCKIYSKDLIEKNKLYSLGGKSISSITVDNDSGIWFSTLENGVYYIKNPFITHLSGFKESEAPISKLFSVADTTLLFATVNGIWGVSHGTIFSVLPVKSNSVSDLLVDNKQLLFARSIHIPNLMKPTLIEEHYCRGFDKAIIFNETLFIINVSNAIKLAYYGTYFMAINNLKVQHVPIDFKANTKCIYKDLSGTIWVGAIDGLYRFDNAMDQIHPAVPDLPELKQEVTCITQLNNGVLCIGTRTGGVSLLKDSTLLGTISSSDGLLSNDIIHLLPVGNDLWVTTHKGISVIRFSSFTPPRYKIATIGRNEGLFNMVIYQLAQFKGSIYAATSKGLYCIDDPASFIDKKPISIPFYLSAVNYYKGDTSNTDHLSVPYTKNRVRLSLSAVCYNMPDSLHYYYRINEQEENWQELTGPELLLENLSPGSYKIELKAAIPHLNRSSTVQTFSLTIEKPWWQNNWFRLGMVLLIGSLIFLFIRFRIKRIQHSEEQKRRLNTKMNELKQISLKAQMNPHFIFNCLTSIQQLIVTGDAREANDALVKFSRLIRKTLELSSELYISIAAEREYLAEYIALEQLRFPNQFTAEFVIDETIDTYTTLIPGMLLQPIIENSIRHGVKHLQERKGRIIISIQQQENTIVCTVRDNGTGRDSSGANATSHKSYGTRIIQQRLDNLAELEGINSISLEIKDLKDGDLIAGTEVTLRLPYKSVTK